MGGRILSSSSAMCSQKLFWSEINASLANLHMHFFSCLCKILLHYLYIYQFLTKRTNSRNIIHLFKSFGSHKIYLVHRQNLLPRNSSIASTVGYVSYPRNPIHCSLNQEKFKTIMNSRLKNATFL